MGEEFDTVLRARFCDPSKIFERMEGGLLRIAKHLAIFAALERHADQAMNGRPHFAHGVQFLINDFGRHAPALKEIAVEAAEIASDAFVSLDLLNPVDRGRLAFIEQLGYVRAAQLREFARQIVA